jgi:hypothetical protein
MIARPVADTPKIAGGRAHLYRVAGAEWIGIRPIFFLSERSLGVQWLRGRFPEAGFGSIVRVRGARASRVLLSASLRVRLGRLGREHTRDACAPPNHRHRFPRCRGAYRMADAHTDQRNIDAYSHCGSGMRSSIRVVFRPERKRAAPGERAARRSFALFCCQVALTPRLSQCDERHGLITGTHMGSPPLVFWQFLFTLRTRRLGRRSSDSNAITIGLAQPTEHGPLWTRPAELI